MIRTSVRNHDPYLEQLPMLVFHEVVDSWITRVVSIFADGHTGVARSRDMLELGGAGVPEHLDPELEPGQKLKDTITVEITSEQFERYWQNAVRRVEFELGHSVPD